MSEPVKDYELTRNGCLADSRKKHGLKYSDDFQNLGSKALKPTKKALENKIIELIYNMVKVRIIIWIKKN